MRDRAAHHHGVGLPRQREIVGVLSLALDEDGLEAAAATGVAMDAVSAPSIELDLVLDRPYLACLHDVETALLEPQTSLSRPKTASGVFAMVSASLKSEKVL